MQLAVFQNKGSLAIISIQLEEHSRSLTCTSKVSAYSWSVTTWRIAMKEEHKNEK